MLTIEQESLMATLTDDFVDNETVVEQEEVEAIMASIRSNPDIYERWNVWNSGVGASTPIQSGSFQTPPTCQQDGTNPCASCDCC